MNDDFIKEILSLFNLGTLKESPIVITGGITNSIYKLIASTGIYAIKIINESKVKQDSNLISTLENSEKIAFIAKKSGINSIVALKFNNKYVNEYKDVYFLIYEWCQGEILLSKEINSNHLKSIAISLATLHNIKVSEVKKIVRYKKIDYRYYYNLLKYNEEKWSIFFKDNINKLINIYDSVYYNYSKLSNQVSYVHKDLNRKNIIWDKNKLNIIDWETATISNPSLDFFSSAWFLTEDIKEEKYKTFTKEYLKIMNLNDDFKVAINCAIIEEFQWLEFSLKRALAINNSNIEEINLGKTSIESSLKEIINYYDKIPLMIKYLNED